jgi:iron complex outermembrane receptor protein
MTEQREVLTGARASKPKAVFPPRPGRKRLLLAGVAALFTVGAGAPAAVAQDETAQEGAAERIVVTARRREEYLQDTPVSITAFTGDALESRQIFSTDNLDQVTPNLQFANNAPLAGNNASSQVFIRGIGQTDPTSTVDPGVALYIDDVYQSGGMGGTMDFRDIANVQVLRGPQGTLFGRNTIGGAIVLTTVEPGDEFGGQARARTGSDSLIDLFGAVDVPMGETVRSRFTAGLRQRDGYVTRPTGEDLGDTNTYTITGKTIFDLTDRFSARVQAHYTRSDENGSPLVFAVINNGLPLFATPPNGAAFPRAASFAAGCPGMTSVADPVPQGPDHDPRCANNSWNDGPFVSNGTFPLASELTLWGASLVLEYELTDQWSFKSVSAYRNMDWFGSRDADNTPLTILHTSYDVDSYDWSQEFQALYESDRFAGVAGLYYFDGESDDNVIVELRPPPGLQRETDDNIASNTNWAVFTEWTWDATDQLSLTLGGRYTEDTKGSIPEQFILLPANPTPQIPIQLYERTFTSFTPSATISYRWSDAVMTYVRYAEGFKGGGWNSHFNANPPPEPPARLALFQPFDPEEAKSTEVGAKLDLLDNTLRVNVAAFTTDYTDLQLTYRLGAAPYLTNTGAASIDGAEIEWDWALGDNWRFDGGFGYLDTSIDELVVIIDPVTGLNAASGINVGNKLPFSPEWQGNAGVSYDMALSSGWSLQPRVDVFYQDETFFDAINTPQIAQTEAVTLWNASLTLNSPNDAWSVFAAINNISDEVYPIAGNSSLATGSGYAEIAYNRGQEWFLGLSTEF